MSKRPQALVLCFFPAFTPPSSGGELRLGGLYRAFARRYDVTLLTSGHFDARYEEIRHSPGFREIRFPKDELWRKAYATLERSGLSGDLSGLAFALAVGDPACALRGAAQEFAAASNVIIHEFPYSEPIFNHGNWPSEIYNAHNVEVGLLSSIARGPGLADAFQKLLRLEGALVRRARKVLATSAVDAETFRLLYDLAEAKVSVCPNGFAEEEFARTAQERLAKNGARIERPRLLFTGSAHYPNVEAVAHIVRLAGDMPDCDFVVAGGVCAAVAHWATPPNLQRLGEFSPIRKLQLFREADVYLNPLLLGSGTSLKAVESLASALPSVSTPEGVRGLGVVPGEHAEIVSRENMPEAIRALCRDDTRRAKLAAAGRNFALARFTWERIAEDMAEAITTDVLASPTGRPFVLALNDYPVDKLRSGGAMRIRMLLGALDSDVILLTFAASCEVALLTQGVLQVTIAKTDAHRACEAAVNQDQPISMSDAVASLFVSGNSLLLEIAATLASRASAVIFEHPYMAPALDAIRSVRGDIPVVYSAHNFEATHKQQMLDGHFLARPLGSLISELERRLISCAHLVVCPSEADARHFDNAKSPVVVSANGCSLPESPSGVAQEDASPNRMLRVGFLGSSHTPNVVAAHFIIAELAPRFPDVIFEFVGSVCDALQPSPHGNLVLHGVLDDGRKSEVMRQWILALNPVESGGGSSLKLPDYMAHGLATLNTVTGARGFSVTENQTGRVVEIANFVATLHEMLRDPASLAKFGAKARDYAERRLVWHQTTTLYRKAFESLLSPPPPTVHRKLLVVTYRYTEPALGGAEEYLIEVVKRLRRSFDQIDIACADIERIGNRHHFGCEFSEGGGMTRRLGGIFDRSFYFPADELAEPDLILKCRTLERAWMYEEFDLLTPFAKSLSERGTVTLLSGFFGLESHGGVTRRWTSPTFSILLPAGTRVLQIEGFVGTVKPLKLTLIGFHPDGRLSSLARSEHEIGPRIDLRIALPTGRGDIPLLLYAQTEEHSAGNDHRPLGLLLEKVCVLRQNLDESQARENHVALDFCHADLSEQVEDRLRESPGAWIDALRNAAQRRKPEIDALFAQVRGPHSATMQAWLRQNCGDYDAVLTQGVPFDVVPRTLETMAVLPNRPRIVCLPHFHADDRFYYWARYFRAFEAADKTLLFSPFLVEQLGEIGKFAFVPGGGVRTDDLGVPDPGKVLRRVRQSLNPFFLVLGRKTGSKGYEQAIRAHQLLRQARPQIDLVLIGPDEDGWPVSGDGVSYLGRQTRDVVRAALAMCLGVVTMSQSESFGIVLCEAWLFGKPVIANANCQSFRELVKHGETGFLVKSETELVLSMKRLVDEPELRRRLGRVGFKNTVENFSWERVARNVAEELLERERDTFMT